MKSSNKLIEQAYKGIEEDDLYKMWLVRYPLYDENNYETFKEFYEKCIPKKEIVCNKTKDELMKEIIGITPMKGDDENGII